MTDQRGRCEGTGLGAVSWYWWKSESKENYWRRTQCCSRSQKSIEFKLGWPRVTLLIVTCCEHPPFFHDLCLGVENQGCVIAITAAALSTQKWHWNIDQGSVTSTDSSLNEVLYQLTIVSAESLCLDNNNVRYIVFFKLWLSWTFHSKLPPCQIWVSPTL